MTTFSRLLAAETRRFHSRDAVKVAYLLGLAIPAASGLSVLGDDTSLVFQTKLVDDTQLLSFFLPYMAALLGATLIGAEWNSGGLHLWLTLEPRRSIVLMSKWAAGVLLLIVFSLVLLMLVPIFLTPAFFAGSLVVDPDWSQLPVLAGIWGRGTLATALMGLLGMTLAEIFRATGPAYVTIAALIVTEPFVAGRLQVLRDFMPFGQIVNFTFGHEMPRSLLVSVGFVAVGMLLANLAVSRDV